MLTKNSSTKLNDFKINKLEIDAKRHWDIFYKNNGARFFKDRNWLERELGQIIDQNKCYSLLEVGCAVGNTVFPLLDVMPKITVSATDFSPRAVDLVKQRAKEGDYGERMPLAFVSDLSKESCFPDEALDKYDFCTSIFVLSALSPEKFPTAIENIKSCFSENSEQKIFFFRDYAVNDHAMLRFKKGKCISDRFYVRQDGTRAYFFNLEELENLITSAGGKVISLEYILRKTVNKAEGIEVPRVFVQGVFQF